MWNDGFKENKTQSTYSALIFIAAYQENGRKKHRDSLRGVGATLRAGDQ